MSWWGFVMFVYISYVSYPQVVISFRITEMYQTSCIQCTVVTVILTPV